MNQAEQTGRRRKLWPKIVAVVLVLGILIAAGSIYTVRRVYQQNLLPVNASQRTRVITIPTGASTKDIARLLKKEGLIRSEWAFERYVSTHEIAHELKAGTYELRPSQSVPEIVAILTDGKIAKNLVTILPAQRLDQIQRALISAGFSEESVKKALDPATYNDHPALVDKPPEASLEGYLYPESFEKTSETKAEDIVRQSLDEMQKRLTPQVRIAITKQGLTVFQGITLASIIEEEVSIPQDKAIVAQVFLKRLRMGMPLQSDPTAFYASAISGQPRSLSIDSPYNTYKYPGLPPGPISNVTESSLQAVINPATTDYLYFVSGDDGTTHFSRTVEEHEALTRKYCTKLCGGQ